MNGWKARPDGWLTHPDYERMLRSRDGRWWVEADVLEGRVEMTPNGPCRVPGWFVSESKWVQEAQDDAEVIELRRRLGEVTG